MVRTVAAAARAATAVASPPGPEVTWKSLSWASTRSRPRAAWARASRGRIWTSEPFPSFPPPPARVSQGVKEWRSIQSGGGLRTFADELGAARAPYFPRRPREAGSPEDERRTAQAVQAAKRGEQEALRYLYLRYADNVYGYVGSIVRDEHEAEDV